MTSNDALITATIEKYQDSILELDNVVAIGIGDKKRENRSLNRLCIKVFVSRKVPTGELPANQVIPEWLEGFETDVEEMEPPEAL